MLYAGVNQLDFKFKGALDALYSTIEDLCITTFWWATFRTTKLAVKMHTLLDLKTAIPEYIFITEGAVHDVNILAHGDFVSSFMINVENPGRRLPPALGNRELVALDP